VPFLRPECFRFLYGRRIFLPARLFCFELGGSERLHLESAFAVVIEQLSRTTRPSPTIPAIRASVSSNSLVRETREKQSALRGPWARRLGRKMNLQNRRARGCDWQIELQQFEKNFLHPASELAAVRCE